MLISSKSKRKVQRTGDPGPDERSLLKLRRPALSPGRAIGGSFSRAFSLREVREKYDRRNCAGPRCDPGVVAITGICSKRGDATT